jgi:DNA repair photolyase
VFVRWDNLRTEQDQATRLPVIGDAVVRTFDAPEALGIRFHEIKARSALNRVPASSRMPFRWTVNPYRGCSHACTYCFARPTHTYLNLNAGRDFEREIVVKTNVPEVLRAELGRKSWKHEHVALGTNTDPYQWVESRYRLMPEIWAALRDSGTPASLVTKSPLVLRDIDILREVHDAAEMSVYLSVPTIDEGAWRETEPHTPSPRARLEAVRKLNEAGVPAGILIAPLMPGINDAPEQVEEIVRTAEDAGAISIGSVALHLRGEVRDIFFGWLREHRPDLIPRYEEIYARGAYAASDERKRLDALVRSSRRRPPRPKPKRSERGRMKAAGEQTQTPPTRRKREPEQPSLF